MSDFDEKLSKDQTAEQEIEEPLTDETLEDVAGGWGSADAKRSIITCPGGLALYQNYKRRNCKECQHYHKTPTHWCALIEKRMNK